MDSVQIILASLVLGLLVVVAIFYWQNQLVISQGKKSKFHKPTFLVVGPLGSGKTALFYSLLTKQSVNTISSLEPNVATLQLPFANKNIQANYQFIDYPGHLKHSQLLRKLITEDITVPKLKGVIYVVDSSALSLAQEGKVAAIARDLFLLLSLTERIPNGVDFLFAVNKQDLFDSRPVHKTKQILEEELGRLIKEQIAAKGSTRGGLGIDNDADEDETDNAAQKEDSTREFWQSVVGARPFKFDSLEGNMEFIGGSVLKGKVSQWENWFDEKAVNYGGM